MKGMYVMIRVGTIFLPNNITFLRKQKKMTQQQFGVCLKNDKN
jgi:hypothetical protein